MGPMMPMFMGGTTMVNFPQYKKENMPKIKIDVPAPIYPQVLLEPKYQQPIVIVPQIIYPHKKKTVIVHNEGSFRNLYTNALNSYSPLWMQMANMNPYFKEYTKKNPAYDNYMNSPDLQDALEAMKKGLSDKKGKLGRGGIKPPMMNI